MPLSATEQYLLELINRGRLDPAAEAARYGIDLNASLAAGTISTTAKQVLAPNARLETAAIGHSQWMLAADIFSHTGQNGSTLGTRASAVGYAWNMLGENIAVWGTSGTLNLTAAIDSHHRGLFLSAGHRTNLMNGTLNEVGLAQETGKFAFSGGAEMNASMLTEMFGSQAGKTFLTGVVYTDADKNSFYSVGEGRSDASFVISGVRSFSEAGGGYSLEVGERGHVIVGGFVGAVGYSAVIDSSGGNVKLDIVNGSTFHTSATMTVGHGILNVNQLGVGNVNLGGNGLGNVLVGNAGSNWLYGYDANDELYGGTGHDALFGGQGDDMLFGGWGNDWVEGNSGNDYVRAGLGQDFLRGGHGADRFVFVSSDGSDILDDFTASQGDILMLHAGLWTGTLTASQVVAQFASVTAAGVVFNFGDGDTLTLNGVTSTAGLAGLLAFW